MLVIGVSASTMYVPTTPRPKWVNKPTNTSNYTVINAAYAGDCLFKMHVRDWLYRHVTHSPTDAHMQKFITNRSMAIYLKKFSDKTIVEYGLNPHSNIHHFGTAFESEYYTNMVFRQMYWVRINQLLPLIDTFGDPIITRDGYNRLDDQRSAQEVPDLLESITTDNDINTEPQSVIRSVKDVFISVQSIVATVVLTVATIILTLPMWSYMVTNPNGWI